MTELAPRTTHVMNRAQIIDDVLHLSWSGFQDYDITFDVLEYLRKEREYLPWNSALDGLGRVYRILQPSNSQYELFKRYMRYIITPVYYHLGGINDTTFQDSTNALVNALHKSLIAGWACRLEIEDCVKNSLKYFREWKSSSQPNEENNIPVDLRNTIYCAAIGHGDDEDWKFLLQRYKESNVATEKSRIISALTCSRDIKILSNYIDLTFDKDQIRKQDSSYAFNWLLNNEYSFTIAKEYFMENIEKLIEHYGPFSTDWGYLLSFLSNRIITSDELKRLNDVIEAKKEFFKNFEKSVESAFETVNFNLDWIDHNVHDTHSSLQRRLRILKVSEEKVQEV